MSYFAPAEPGQAVRAFPGQGLHVPIYLLGSSDFSARLAAELGLPFAFASHFAPDYLLAALRLYRENFKPSAELQKPYAMAGVNIIAAESDAEALQLFTSVQQQFLNLTRGMPGQLPPPVQSMDGRWSPAEQAHVERMTLVSAVGSASTVREFLESLLQQTGVDELIVTAHIFDHAARLRSFEIAAQVFEAINSDRKHNLITAGAAGDLQAR